MCRSEKLGWMTVIHVLPMPNASLYCTTDTLTDFRMVLVNLSQHGDWAQPGSGPEHRHDLAVPNPIN
jgi:hypothetical protein